ncbi:MAG TPA: T9SS type A sorting domain-containing protein, partial [Flavisolibacter sp.]
DKQVGRYNSKILHYRIKQYDLDGKFSYSPIKTVRLDVKGETSLFPNPAKEGFTLTIPYLNPNQDKVQLHLVNPLGQVVDRKDITRLAAVNYYYNLQSSLITSGEYLLKIFEDGQLTETKRVLIKK